MLRERLTQATFFSQTAQLFNDLKMILQVLLSKP